MFIKRPGGARKSYSLVGHNGKVIHDERIDLVNKDFAAGVSRDILEQRMKLIMNEKKPVLTQLDFTNMRLAKQCHTTKIKHKPRLADARPLWSRLRRTVEALGSIDLATATEDSLLDQISPIVEQGPRYHVIGGINELLNFMGRELRLENPRPQYINDVEHITVEFFVNNAHKLPTDFAAYMGGLFAFGLRLGELPTAEINGQIAYISKQLKREGKITVTKNKKPRHVPVILPLMPFVTRLNALGSVRVNELRLTHHRAMLNACKDILGLSKLHNLRHSYAVAQRKVGITIKELAEYIGDTEQVVRDHYARFGAPEEQLQRAIARWK